MEGASKTTRKGHGVRTCKNSNLWKHLSIYLGVFSVLRTDMAEAMQHWTTLENESQM